MLLALSVISENAATLGAGGYKVFDEHGGSIGRVSGNDWMLPDPEKFVSSRHATILCEDGRFLLQDTSTNGTFINEPGERASREQPVVLRDGDRLFIGEYEILVQLIEGDAPAPAPEAGDPLLGLPPAAPPPSAQGPAPHGSGAYTRPPFPQPQPPPSIRADATASVPFAREAASAGYGASAAQGVDDFLSAMGLNPAHVEPAVYQQMGDIVRIVVQGLIDVLQARAEIKNNFRMPMTSLRPVENNPLKFSMNADDALHNLFVKRNPGYLRPVESFQEAFQDISFHQMAMLAGIRAAYDAMLAKLHPDHLEELFDRKLKRTALLSVGRQSKFWDLYREQFEDIDSDVEAHFQRLFGEEFAKAYNEQLQRLTAAARAQRR